MKPLKTLSYIVLLFLSGVFNESCVNYKSIPYFTNLNDSSRVTELGETIFKNPIIRPDDILNISIQTLEPNVDQLINSGNVTVSGVGSSVAQNLNQAQSISGYLVDKNGEISFPYIGKLKIDGLSTIQARDLLVTSLSKYLKDPIVSVRFANFKVTILGEVARPAAYTIATERVSILDAIGLAGDLTIYGKRENILLIRKRGDVNISTRLNLNSKDILSSPYFYLEPNDVLYIEPSRVKIANSDEKQIRYFSVATSTLTVILLFIIRIIK